MTYLPVANGNTAGLVSQYKVEKVGGGVLLEDFYTYDDNGNIRVIRYGLDYEYDGLNRLVSENDGRTILYYNYDDGGNLTTVDQVRPNKPLSTLHTYTYGNPNWTDQLTAFDNKPITYDALGNPLTYDGYTYTWEKGRQLTGITGNGKNISYTYDAQGRRTSKTVNGVTTTYTYSGSLLMRQQGGGDTLDFQYDASGTA